ncbi:MAG: DsrE family protein [Thalassobaculum sp.]
MMIRTLASLLFAIGILIGGLTPAKPALAEDATIVVSMTTDDGWTSQMALGFARTMQKDGVAVVVFLNVRAVSLGIKGVPQAVQAASGKTAHEMIAEILANGGRVFICPSCTNQSGLDIADRLEGIEPGGLPLRQIMMAPATKIISF